MRSLRLTNTFQIGWIFSIVVNKKSRLGVKVLDLDKKYVDFIKATVLSEVPNAEIFVFGSRTQGNALKYSDVDIALKCEQKIPIVTILMLRAKFSDSTFPYKVDIVDLNDLKPEFKKIIEKDLYRI